MRLELPWLAPLALAVAAPASAAPQPSATLTLPLAAPFIEATIDGAPVCLRVALDAPGIAVLTPAAARRLGLVSQAPSYYSVGPITLTGGSRDVALGMAGGQVAIRALWNSRAPTDDPPPVDGVIGPGPLPYAAVRLVRPGPAGRRAVLRITPTPTGELENRAGGGIRVRLAPTRPDTLATASAGAILARTRGGASAPAEPPARPILFGIDRPVARLTLARPLRIAGQPLARVLVRTADFGGGAAARTAADPDEIVVTGRSATRPRRLLSLGADLLGRCTAFEWTASTRRITLDCP